MNDPFDDAVQQHVPTYAKEAEDAILGGLMLSPNLFDDLGDLLQPGDFFFADNQRIFEAIAGLINAGKSCDAISVWEQLNRSVELLQLHALTQYVPSSASARRHAQIIRERALSRKLLAASSEIQDLAHDHAMAFEERLERATANLAKLLPDAAGDGWIGSDQLMIDLLGRIQARSDGVPDGAIPTGLRDLDSMLNGGMRPGQLIIVAARPSIGKSALGMTIGMNVAMQHSLPVGMFSFEMSREELGERQVSMVSKIHLTNVVKSERLCDHDWSQLSRAVDTIRAIPFKISEVAGLNINQVRTKARNLKRSSGLKLLVVDYLGLMSGTNPKDNRNNQLGEVSRGLKSLAKELGIPIIALAQMGRDIEKRVVQRPMLSDLRDSGEIEQDADVVIFIDRPYHSKPELGESWRDYAELILAKQRNGPTGSINARYVGKNVTFLDWDDEKPSKLGGSSRRDL